jgi:hypothetical protein
MGAAPGGVPGAGDDGFDIFGWCLPARWVVGGDVLGRSCVLDLWAGCVGEVVGQVVNCDWTQFS